MPKKKSKTESMDSTHEFNLDSIIGDVGAKLKLPPTNLQRGSLIRDAVSTDSLSMDLILGGGYPPGMVSIPFGPEQSGKTTAGYHGCKSAVAQGIHTLMFDWEGATDADRIERLGLKIDWAKEASEGKPVLFRYYNAMKYGEDMFTLMKRVLDQLPEKTSGPPQICFFVDSLPAVVPRALEDNEENAQAARRAAMYSDMLPQIKSRLSAKRGILFATNQLRKNPRAMFGNPEYEPCGEAVKYYSDVRLRMKKTVSPWGGKSYVHDEPGWTGEGIDRYSFTKVTTTKNKAFSPNREAVIRIWFEENGESGRGFDPVWDVYQFLKLTGQVKRGRRKEKSTKESCLIFDIKDQAPFEEPLLYHEFKALILDPKHKGTDHDLQAFCRKQLVSNKAFELYYENLSGVSREDAKTIIEVDSVESDDSDLNLDV